MIKQVLISGCHASVAEGLDSSVEGDLLLGQLLNFGWRFSQALFDLDVAVDGFETHAALVTFLAPMRLAIQAPYLVLVHGHPFYNLYYYSTPFYAVFKKTAFSLSEIRQKAEEKSGEDLY